MLRHIFKFYPRRNFSNSAAWKDSKKEVTTPPKQEAQTAPPQGTDFRKAPSIDLSPNELEKFILVYSGTYKSKADIPPRVSYSAIDTAKSKVRIKVSNYLMVATLLVCAYYVWVGKKKAEAGETINAKGRAYQKKILEEAGIKREY